MIDDLISHQHLGPFLSAVLIYGFGTLGFGAIVAHALVLRFRKLREARAADASVDVHARLAPGRAIVCGAVEYAQGALQAVRVNIEQDGEESESSGVWSHKWTEKNRRINVEPFYLRVNADKRIRIEPTQKVFLVDDMDGLIRVDLTQRVKFAQLTPGERVFASGELVKAHDPEAPTGTGGYRSSTDSLVLRPLAGETMLLSSEPLGARYRARAAFYAKCARRISALAVVLHVLFGGYHLRRFIGETISIPITKLEPYTTRDDDGDLVYHYRVIAMVPSSGYVSDDVDHKTFERLRAQQVIPFRVVTGQFSKSSTIGADVTASFAAFMLVPWLCFAWFFYRYHEKKSRPWYERDVVDTGSGRLEATFTKEREASARS